MLVITAKFNLLQVKGKGASGSFVVVQKSRKTPQKSRNKKVRSLYHSLYTVILLLLLKILTLCHALCHVCLFIKS